MTKDEIAEARMLSNTAWQRRAKYSRELIDKMFVRGKKPCTCDTAPVPHRCTGQESLGDLWFCNKDYNDLLIDCDEEMDKLESVALTDLPIALDEIERLQGLFTDIAMEMLAGDYDRVRDHVREALGNSAEASNEA